MRNRLPFPLLVAAAVLLVLVSPTLPAEPDEPEPLPTASVTAEKLEALFGDASMRSALGITDAQAARIDAWVPEGME